MTILITKKGILITKKGMLPELQRYKFWCSHCKTEFSAQQSDGIVRSDTRDKPYLTVKCPLCARDVLSDVRAE